ncbi:hypothetical protein GCM10010492_18520 [Saccharothrix mutabilis subsp. mutabilis]|uniref:Uncharacterized protein n=1 Tax=Saccharothrix mutabilis subsp. mutabilis TaxID=66855 RepID=A0ABN0TFX6_9PSEU
MPSERMVTPDRHTTSAATVGMGSLDEMVSLPTACVADGSAEAVGITNKPSTAADAANKAMGLFTVALLWLFDGRSRGASRGKSRGVRGRSTSPVGLDDRRRGDGDHASGEGRDRGIHSSPCGIGSVPLSVSPTAACT